MKTGQNPCKNKKCRFLRHSEKRAYLQGFSSNPRKRGKNMRKLREMCVGVLAVIIGIFVAFAVFFASGLMAVLVWMSESVACMRDEEPPEGL